MSNLTDLLPAGAGGKQVDFVASGTLGNGVTVALKADGTVEAVGETTITEGAGTAVSATSSSTEWNSIAYDSTNNKVIAIYVNFGSNLGECVIGTVSGSTISWGTPVVFNSGNTGEMACVHDINNNKIVIVYQDFGNSSYGTAIVGTVSGTSISFGSETVFKSSATSSISACYDEASGNVVIGYMNSAASPYNNFVLVGSVSGSSISFGSSVAFTSWNTGASSGLVYDPNAAKVLCVTKSSGGGGYAAVGTVTGTSISLGTGVTFSASTDSVYFAAAYDANAQKILVVYDSYISSTRSAHSIVATISGTSVSFGTETAMFASATQIASWILPAYNTLAKKITSFATKSAGGSVAIVSTISGTSVSNGSPYTLSLPGIPEIKKGISPVYDSSAGKTAVVYCTFSGGATGVYSFVWTTGYTATNAPDFIGITAEAISDTATGAVNVYGGINEAQTGLTIGSDYYVQADGSLSTTSSDVKVGQAISATTINMMDLT